MSHPPVTTLYAPVSNAFLQRVADARLLTLVPAPPALPYALFDRPAACACPTRDRLALHHQTLFARDHPATGFPAYALPDDCTPDETVVAVTWLLRHQFRTFHTRFHQGSLVRLLGPADPLLFKRTPLPCGCERYTLRGDPVFLLKHCVLSSYQQGPTLDSALLKPSCVS